MSNQLQEIQKRIKEAEALVKELQTLEQQEKAQAVNPFYCEKGVRITMTYGLASFFTGIIHSGGLNFPNVSVAKQYADAMNVMFELRRCDGVTTPAGETSQTTIRSDGSLIEWSNYQNKVELVAPVFKSRADAIIALEKVGKERIVKAMRVLQGIFD